MLKRLDLEYIDLVLLHFPFNDYLGAYKELEEEYEKGHIKNIGISNFEDSKFEDLYNKAKIKPVLNQIELHPYFQQREIRKKNGRSKLQNRRMGPPLPSKHKFIQ